MGDLIVDVYFTPSPRVELFDPVTFERWSGGVRGMGSAVAHVLDAAATRGITDVYVDTAGVGMPFYEHLVRRRDALRSPLRVHAEPWSANHVDDERLVDVKEIQRIERDLVAVTGQRATGHPTQLLLRLPPRVAQALELATEKVGTV